MTITSLMRYHEKYYLNTGTATSPTWSAINKGVTSATINWNVSVEEEHYIADVTATKTATGMAPELPLDMSGKAGDPAYDFIADIMWNQKVGSAAETDLLIVNTGADAVSGAYPAKKQKVNVSVNSSGGDGGKALKQSATLLWVGDFVAGTFNPTTSTFTASGT